VNRGPVVDAALRQAPYGCAWRLIAFRRVHQALCRYGSRLGRGAIHVEDTAFACGVHADRTRTTMPAITPSSSVGMTRKDIGAISAQTTDTGVLAESPILI
jgi:hypothetical protein